MAKSTYGPLSSLAVAALLITTGCLGPGGGRITRTSPEKPGPVQALPAGEAQQSPLPQSAAAAAEARAEREPRKAAPADPIAQIIARSQEEYETGMAALRNGDVEEARSRLERALEMIRTCGYPPESDPRLLRAYESLMQNVADLEADIEEPPQHPSEGEQISPADELGEMNVEPTPEVTPQAPPATSGEATFDIPMVVNDKVMAWVEIFRTRRPFTNSFVSGYQRYGWYEEMIHRIFREEGLPQDLIYVAFMESTYKTSAYSRARARGIWQFMTPTGREYGLKVNKYVDERSHPEKSTRAAARYLRDLYATFGDWHLAIAAYNTGAGNVMRAQRRSGKTDYWDLAKSRHMRTETKNFVPGILALALMAKSPEKFGFEGMQHNETLTFDRVAVRKPTKLATIARLSGATEEQIKFLNPHLRLGVTPPGERNYEVLVPAGMGETFMARYDAAPLTETVAALDGTHRVRKGETLASIAAKYGTTVHEVASANNIRNANRLQVGMELSVPGGALEAAPAERSTKPRHSTAPRRGPYHVVRRGDTLFSIARSYGLSLKTLLNWNGLSERTIIKPGFRLIVGKASISELPGPGAEVAAADGTGTPAGTVVVPGGGESAPDPGGEKVLYKVRNGDTLHRIAGRFRTTVDNLKAWNRLPGDSIRAGEVLTIYSN